MVVRFLGAAFFLVDRLAVVFLVDRFAAFFFLGAAFFFVDRLAVVFFFGAAFFFLGAAFFLVDRFTAFFLTVRFTAFFLTVRFAAFFLVAIMMAPLGQVPLQQLLRILPLGYPERGSRVVKQWKLASTWRHPLFFSLCYFSRVPYWFAQS